MKNKEENIALLPTNDYVFKRIFGYVGSEKFTGDLLESVLDCDVTNIDLDKNTFLEKDFVSNKMGILDVRAILNNNISCDIEVQVVPYDYLAKRILFYWAKLYSNSAKRGKNYNESKRTVIVLFIDFEFSKLDEKLSKISEFHTKWHIREDKHPEYVLSDVLEIHIISLKVLEKLNKLGYNKLSEREKNLINWLKFIKNPNLMGVEAMKNENIREAKKIFDELQEDEIENARAEARLSYIMEINSATSSGYDSGKKEEKIEIAKKMIKRNEDISKIMEYTGLTKEEIESLK